MRAITFVLLTVAVLATPVFAAGPKHTKDSLETVRKNLNEKKAVLFDVRERKEWDAGHLEAATLVPLSELKAKGESAEFVKELSEKVGKKKIVYCHCRSGARVVPASAVLKKLGYDVRPLKWGFKALVEAGFKQAKEESN